ncbi:MAG TPA: DUF932 domain-containing protein [Opitutaceae bacterium]
MSGRYTFVSTAQVVDLLHGEGWEPVLARQQRVRLANRQGFQMHEIRFARRDGLGRSMSEVGEVRPELILQNAHDGTHAYRIAAGLYRLVCRNGLIVADAHFARVAIRHLDVNAERFAAAAQSIVESTPRVLEIVARWQSIQLTPSDRQHFAARAAGIRWNPQNPVLHFLPPDELLRPLRYGDDNSDLWTTFNVCQEHLLRGGDRYVARGQHGIRRNSTRPVGGLTQAAQLNKALWELAEEFARN